MKINLKNYKTFPSSEWGDDGAYTFDLYLDDKKVLNFIEPGDGGPSETEYFIPKDEAKELFKKCYETNQLYKVLKDSEEMDMGEVSFLTYHLTVKDFKKYKTKLIKDKGEETVKAISTVYKLCKFILPYSETKVFINKCTEESLAPHIVSLSANMPNAKITPIILPIYSSYLD